MENDNKKTITLEEYQDKYSKPENVKKAKQFLVLFTLAIGVIIFTCLFFMVLKVYDINKYAGYVSIGVATIIFLVIYIIPVIRINSMKSFITNVDETNAIDAKKYNKKLRFEIAEKMIDMHLKTNEYYGNENISKLIIAKEKKDNEEIKNCLTNIYKTDVKEASNKMIRDYALKIGFSTALSQSEKLDTLFVVTYDLQLIKNIVFLYGYRPSDNKMVKIYKNVIRNALIAYGVGNITSNASKGVIKKLGKAGESLPIIGSALSTIIDSSLQGVTNSAFTVMLGFQTKKYLRKEYKLQDILDNILVSEEEELEEQETLNEEIKADLKVAKKANA